MFCNKKTLQDPYLNYTTYYVEHSPPKIKLFFVEKKLFPN